MPDLNDFTELVDQISRLESDSASLSTRWYEVKPTDMTEVQKVTENCSTSLKYLQAVASKLDNQLRTSAMGAVRDQLQYAYNLVRELIQSRQANLELLQVILGDSTAGTAEYFRAISVKERAAQDQCDKLQNALRGLS